MEHVTNIPIALFDGLLNCPRCIRSGSALGPHTRSKICTHRLDAMEFAEFFWDEC